MVYQVPKSKKSLKQNKFEFTIAGDPDEGRVYSLPLLKYISPALARRLGSESPVEGMGVLFDEYIGEEILGKFEDMEQLEGLFTALQEASGATAGESSASTDS